MDTLVNGGAQLLLIPLTFIRLPILTKNLSIQDYGLWGLIFTTCSLALPFTSLGLGAAMSRFLPGEKGKEVLQEGFYSVLTLRMLVTCVVAGGVYLFAAPIANMFFDGHVSIVRITALFILLTTLHGIYRRLLRILRKIEVLSIISILDGYISIAVFAVLLHSGYGLMSIVLAQLAIKIAEISYLILYVKPLIGFKWPNFKPIKEYLNYGVPTLPASMSFWLVNITDRFIISFLLSTSAVGIYSAAYAIGNIPYMISGLINFIMMIALSELYDSGKLKEVQNHLSYGLKYFLALSIPFFFGSLIYSEQILYTLSTHEIARQAGLITPIVSLAHILLGIYSVLTYILLLRKKTKVLPMIWLVSLSLNLGLNFYLIPRLGSIGAAISTLIAYAIALVAVIYFAMKEFRFNVNWLFILKSVCASLIMSGVLKVFPRDGNLLTFVAIAVSIGLYFILIFIMKGFTNKEYELFHELIRGLLRGRTK
jgi:O-antigen/teichoic acid export membrane protein